MLVCEKTCKKICSYLSLHFYFAREFWYVECLHIIFLNYILIASSLYIMCMITDFTDSSSTTSGWRMVSWGFASWRGGEAVDTWRRLPSKGNNQKWWVPDCFVSVLGRAQAFHCTDYRRGEFTSLSPVIFMHVSFFCLVFLLKGKWDYVPVCVSVPPPPISFWTNR
jgi:hypothetical protein